MTLPRILPTLDELRERAVVVTCPLRVPFRGVTEREIMLLEGPHGWVEWSPFLEYGPREASRWLRSALLLGWGSERRGSLGSPGPQVGVGGLGGVGESVRASGWGPAEAGELGNIGTCAPVGGTSTSEEPGVRPASALPLVEVNATIPAVDVTADPEAVPRLLERYPGCTTVKVKVAQAGQSLSDDLARVRAVREARPGIAVRVDANTRWTVDEAFEAAVALTDAHTGGGPLDYMEQPCATVVELAELRRRLGSRGMMVRIAADELIRKASDPMAVVTAGACDVAVLKVAPLGGVDQVWTIAKEVGRLGVAVTISSALESAVGMYAGLLAAATLPGYIDDAGLGIRPPAAGLATGSLYAEDVCGPREIIDGRMAVQQLVPDQARLTELAASATRRDWWFQRLAQSHTHL